MTQDSSSIYKEGSNFEEEVISNNQPIKRKACLILENSNRVPHNSNLRLLTDPQALP